MPFRVGYRNQRLPVGIPSQEPVVGRLDAVAFAGTAAVMLLVAIAASYIPALRASRVDPVVALRAE